MTTLTMRRGTTASWTTTIKRGNTPIALGGGTLLWWTAKRSYLDSDAQAVFQKRQGAGITIDPDQGANPGQITLTLLPADTAGLPGKEVTLVWDLQCKETDGTYSDPDSGELVVSPDVTQTIV